MTKAEFDSCHDPQKLLGIAVTSGKASDRKLRLYAVAYCRSVWGNLAAAASRKAVEVAEDYADRRATPQELADAGNAALEAPWTFVESGDRYGECTAHAAAWTT